MKHASKINIFRKSRRVKHLHDEKEGINFLAIILNTSLYINYFQ